ncbi:MAG TPA: DNA (cytosine-5-)-methyltransferase [Candidatus Limisoma gallistercoris]|nr:DNA (cytosine-5-)-methyltransferase [Candidatus Limisoma gallistercoris]
MAYQYSTDENTQNNVVSDVISNYQPSLFPKAETDDKGKLRVLSLFSGCGGMDIGFEGGFICHRKSINPQNDWIEEDINSNWVKLKETKFITVFANDIMEEAKSAWTSYMCRRGHSYDSYHLGSIVDIVKSHKLGINEFPSDIDIVTGGFPCQDFSVAGKRKGFNSNKDHNGKIRMDSIPSEETRGKLYFWMKQVIDITKPKIFIAENVKGLVNLGDVKSIIQQDFASASDNGYIVLTPQVLHAADYGVPESRERVIFIGIRKDALKKEALEALQQEKVPEAYNPYPQPTHSFNSQDQRLVSPVVCGDIFEGLKEPDKTEDLSQKYYSKAKYMGEHCQGQKEIALNKIAPTIRSEHHGNIEFRRLSIEHGGKIEQELQIGLKERRLTPRECALIQTFPPDYSFVRYKPFSKSQFQVSSSMAYKVIGNAVPPILAYNIATRIQSLWRLYFK